jgi:hypothetical protein
VTSTADVLYSFLAKDERLGESLALWKWVGNRAGLGVVFDTDILLSRHFISTVEGPPFYLVFFCTAAMTVKSFWFLTHKINSK